MISQNLKIVTLQHPQEWDQIVRSFSDYDVYYLSGYVKAFQIHGDGEPLLFYYEGENLRGINVVMKRDVSRDPHFIGQVPENSYFDFATPYGYGGWLLEGEGNPGPLYTSYQNWCLENGIVDEFVRFSLFSNSRETYYGEVIPRTGNIVRRLDLPMDDIRMDFEHKVRKNIRKAEQQGLTVSIDPEGERLEEFLSIYNRTMDRNHAERAYYFGADFFRQMNTLSENVIYFHVLLEGKIISTELVLLGSKMMYSYLGGTDDTYFSCRPNDFLKYQIILWGAAHGYQAFILGGGYGADDGIYRYKKSFAPHGDVQFYTGQAIFDSDQYEKLIAIRGSLPECAFFPRYRA